MPPATAHPTAPSQLLAAAVTAFRNLVATVQGTSDPGNQLTQMVSSMDEMATMFESCHNHGSIRAAVQPAGEHQQPGAAADQPAGDDQQPAQQRRAEHSGAIGCR